MKFNNNANINNSGRQDYLSKDNEDENENENNNQNLIIKNFASIIHTRHTANIFGVRFIPQTDYLVFW